MQERKKADVCSCAIPNSRWLLYGPEERLMSVMVSRLISANLKYGRMNCLDAYGRVQFLTKYESSF